MGGKCILFLSQIGKKQQKLLTIQFINLNQEGRKRLTQQAEDISEIDKYKKCFDTEQNVG